MEGERARWYKKENGKYVEINDKRKINKRIDEALYNGLHFASEKGYRLESVGSNKILLEVLLSSLTLGNLPLPINIIITLLSLSLSIASIQDSYVLEIYDSKKIQCIITLLGI